MECVCSLSVFTVGWIIIFDLVFLVYGSGFGLHFRVYLLQYLEWTLLILRLTVC